MNIYAVYKGDEFLDLGTAKELSKKFNVKEKTIHYWSTPTNRKRNKNGMIVIKVEE